MTEKACPYMQAKGWHMWVGYHLPGGATGYACHGCGEVPQIEKERLGL